MRNVVNRHDLAGLIRTVRRRQVIRRLAPARYSRKLRAEAAWAHTESPTNWWNVPRVVEHRRRLVSGDPQRDHREHIVAAHLAGRTELHGLSVGCGTGSKELAWARSGVFARLDACDISGPRVEMANEQAARAGFGHVLAARKVDVFALEYAPQTLDVVIGEDAIHHLTPLDDFFARVECWLKPGGLLVVNEFVGPTRFQWTGRQLEMANALLRVLPERLRTSARYGGPKREVVRPSLMRMYFSDPSESVESGAMEGLVRARFDVVEDVALGGTLSMLVLADIAQHFVEPDAVASAFLDAMLALEDELIAAGDLSSDYRLMVCRRR